MVAALLRRFDPVSVVTLGPSAVESPTVVVPE
jgi:hypothetical protein